MHVSHTYIKPKACSDLTGRVAEHYPTTCVTYNMLNPYRNGMTTTCVRPDLTRFRLPRYPPQLNV